MPKGKQKNKSLKKYIATFMAVLCLVMLGLGWWLYSSAYEQYDGTEDVMITIPPNSDYSQIEDSLVAKTGDYGHSVLRMLKLRNYKPATKIGIYRISPGDKAWSVSSRIKSHNVATIRLTYNNIRLLEDLAKKIAVKFPWDDTDFIQACARVLPHYGFDTPEKYPAAFLPDTYEFYADATPDKVVETLVEHRNKFWNEERRAKAYSLGLTPVQVSTIASIVEEETANKSEQSTVARLYLNRYHKGMKLQADPTVKFALKDFGLKRLRQKHLETPSPYNTYQTAGLPPGPIRIAEKTTMEAVLNAPENEFLYMCAKPDGSRTHNFAKDYATHQKNAAAYRKWIDSLGIF